RRAWSRLSRGPSGRPSALGPLIFDGLRCRRDCLQLRDQRVLEAALQAAKRRRLLFVDTCHTAVRDSPRRSIVDRYFPSRGFFKVLHWPQPAMLAEPASSMPKRWIVQRTFRLHIERQI